MNSFSEDERATLLDIVDKTIKNGLENRKLLEVTLKNFPVSLQEIAASFVTLKLHSDLRGCIGTLDAYQPLLHDVIKNAYSAAFHDPRFLPLRNAEFSKITKQISILSASQPLEFSSEENLLELLRPNVDGLILIEKGLRGTFLPSVWEFLTEPREFLNHLKMKAGLPFDYWSDTIKIERYTTEVIE